MKIFQDFSEEDKQLIYKDLWTSEQSSLMYQFESIVCMMEIAFSLAQGQPYLTIDLEHETLESLQNKLSPELQQKWNIFLRVLLNYQDILEILKVYDINLYAQIFVTEIAKNANFKYWHFSNSNAPVVSDVVDPNKNHRELLIAIRELQHKLMQIYNSSETQLEYDFKKHINAIRRNTNKNYQNLYNNVDQAIKKYNGILVVPIAISYQLKHKSSMTYEDVKKHRQIFLEKIAGAYQRYVLYHGFFWRLHTIDNRTFTFQFILLFNPKLTGNNEMGSNIHSCFKDALEKVSKVESNDENTSEGQISLTELITIFISENYLVHIEDPVAMNKLQEVVKMMTKLSFYIRPNLNKALSLYKLNQSNSTCNVDDEAISNEQEVQAEIACSGSMQNPNQLLRKNKQIGGNLFSSKIYL